MKTFPHALLALAAVLALLPSPAAAVVSISPCQTRITANGAQKVSLDPAKAIRDQVANDGAMSAQNTAIATSGDGLSIVSSGSCSTANNHGTTDAGFVMRFTTDKPLPFSMTGSFVGGATCTFTFQGTPNTNFSPVHAAGVSVPLNFSADLPPGDYLLVCELTGVPGQPSSWNFRVNAISEIHWIKPSRGSFGDARAWDPAQVPDRGATGKLCCLHPTCHQ